MISIVKKLLSNRYEYLTLDRNFLILDVSPSAQRFAEIPDELQLGNDVRLSFPELIGLEETLLNILEGKQISFELKGIARSSEPTSPLYIDLYVSEYSDGEDCRNTLLILLEDVTERMVLQQNLVQQTNEVRFLLSSLTTSKKYIDKVIESMADVLLVTTTTGVIKTVNQYCQDLFGYSQEELINQPISKLILEEKLLSKITNLYSPDNLLKDVEVLCQSKTGEEIPVAFSCSIIQTEIEGLQNLVYIGRDIRERKRLEAKMIKALEREIELRELKSNFVSMASHEFRTPLTAIFSSTELLEQYGHKWPEDKKLKHYQRIELAVKRMTALLDDVLLYSKAEAGKLEFNPKPLVLKDFCSDLIEEIQISIGKDRQITGVYSEPCTTAYLDEKILLQILTNLLTNAIKYSPSDTTVYFDCYCEGEEVIFVVKDEGIGIPAEDQAQLFESFHRAKNVGNIPGTGLGLAIVQRSVELHGGRIMFTSKVGVGTTVKVTLPLDNSRKTP